MKYTRDWDLDSIPYDVLQSAAARRRRAHQYPPTPEKLKPCPYGCGEVLGVVRMRKHKPNCRRKESIPVRPLREPETGPRTAGVTIKRFGLGLGLRPTR